MLARVQGYSLLRGWGWGWGDHDQSLKQLVTSKVRNREKKRDTHCLSSFLLPYIVEGQTSKWRHTPSGCI